MNSKQITLVALAVVGRLGTGLAQAQASDVQWSVTAGSPVGMPVYNQSIPVHALPIPAARPVPVRLLIGFHRCFFNVERSTQRTRSAQLPATGCLGRVRN